MLFILKAIFTFIILSFIGAFIAGLSLFVRLRQGLNPFLRTEARTPPPSSGGGEIIEGEYKVIDEE